MKKFAISGVLLATFLSSSLLFAQSISKEVAQKVAGNFYFSKDLNLSSRRMVQITATEEAKWNDETMAYIFQIEDGFVIVANEMRVNPILGYGIHEGGNVDTENPAFNYWMEGYKKQIYHVKHEAPSFQPESKVQEAWQILSADNFSRENATQKMQSSNGGMGTTAVAPLVTTTWGQGSSSAPSYNYYCPASGGVTAITGCVATAMAQVMRYHNHPTYGNGSSSYVEAANYNSTTGAVTQASYGTLSANYGTTTYSWSNMPTSITSASALAQRQAIGTLMKHCGVSVEMNYSPSSSGATTADAVTAFQNYFHYTTSGYQQRSSYTTATWITYLKSQLDLNRPMVHRGNDPAEGGHAWVCDGYDASNNFHMNWGWNGSSNGYFSVDDMTPGGYNFYVGHAVIAITPKSLTVSTPTINACYNTSVYSTTVTSNATWTVTDNATWITTSVTSGSNNASFNINLTANTTGVQRTGTITVKGGGRIRTITVTQKPQVTFTATSTFYPGTQGARYDISVASTGNWTATDNATWITMNTSTGTSATTTLSFTTATNTLTTNRTGSITLTGPCGETKVITVIQANKTVACPTITGVTATNPTATSFTVNWTANANASFYRIYYKKSTSSVWLWKGSWASAPVTISGLTSTGTYQVMIESACSGTTTGNVSAIASVIVSAPNGKVENEGEEWIVTTDGEGLADGIIERTASSITTESKVYPNPTHDMITIEVPVAEGVTVHTQVIDLSGKVLMESTQDATSNVYSQELSLSQLPTGLYIVSIQYGNERRNHKVQVIQE